MGNNAESGITSACKPLANNARQPLSRATFLRLEMKYRMVGRALSRELNATRVNLCTSTARSNFTEFLTYSEYNSAVCNLTYNRDVVYYSDE